MFKPEMLLFELKGKKIKRPQRFFIFPGLGKSFDYACLIYFELKSSKPPMRTGSAGVTEDKLTLTKQQMENEKKAITPCRLREKRLKVTNLFISQLRFLFLCLHKKVF